MKIKNIKISNKKYKKALIGIAIASLSTILFVSSTSKPEEPITFDTKIESLYDISDLVDELDPTTYKLNELELLVENEGNGCINYHFIKDKDAQKEKTENYEKTTSNLKSVTTKKEIVSEKYDYGNIIGEYDTIPNVEKFIPDSNIKYQIIPKDSINLLKNYDSNKSYTRKELKEIEKNLDENFDTQILEDAKSYGEKSYYIDNLCVLLVDGKVIINDTSEIYELTDITKKDDLANVRSVYYMFDITDPKVAIRYNDGETRFSKYLKNTRGVFTSGLNLKFESVTTLDKTDAINLNTSYKKEINIYDYLSPEIINKGVVTSSELLDIVNEINSSNIHYL